MKDVKNILYKEVKLIIYIITMVVTVLSFLFKPVYSLQGDVLLMQKDIQTIESNHLTHIQTSIAEIKKENSLQTESINNLNINVAELKTLLQQLNEK